MNIRLNDLWSSAAHDGASCPIGVLSGQPTDRQDINEVMDAWYRERAAFIECSLLLERSQNLMARLLADDEISPRRRQQLRSLLATIRNAEHGRRDTRRS
ncbi:MAG: hypothetical protein NVSMB9_26010 [Isosphaeraceae bacterium]